MKCSFIPMVEVVIIISTLQYVLSPHQVTNTKKGPDGTDTIKYLEAITSLQHGESACG